MLTFDVNPPRSGVYNIRFSVLRKRGSDCDQQRISADVPSRICTHGEDAPGA